MTARAMGMLAGLVVAAGGTGGAWGQVTTTASTVTYGLTWVECDGAGQPVQNPNGVLSPGEGVLLRMTVSFTNLNGTGAYMPPNPAPGSGTIRGFGAGFIDVNVTSAGSTTGTWLVSQASGLGVLSGWDLVGPTGNGTPANGGANLQNIQFGQFPINASAIVTTNPIVSIWQGAWIPNSYTLRDVTLTVGAALAAGGNPSSVLFKTSATGLASAYTPSVFGSVTVPIPGPGGAAGLGVGCAWLGRRRRGGKLPNCQRAR